MKKIMSTVALKIRRFSVRGAGLPKNIFVFVSQLGVDHIKKSHI